MRGADQEFLKITIEQEPVFDQVIKQTEQRGLVDFQPQNGGVATPERYTTESVLDYFEGDLDTEGCSCGFTLRELIEKFDIDISSVQNKLNSGDVNGDGEFSICGNVVLVKAPKVNLRADSPQIDVEGSSIQTIESRISYSKHGQILKVETPEGEISEFFYYPENDPDGDGEDVLSGENHLGQPFDAQAGYLKEIVVDSAHSSRYRGTVAPTKITTRIGYDRLGNAIFTINPRGIRSEFVYNSLNQVVQTKAATDVSEATEGHLTTFDYKSNIFYDHNGNVVRTEIEYRDGNNPDLPDFIEATIEYDILDNPIKTTQRVDNNETITSEMRYDENILEVKTPLAVSGVDTNNITRVTYDERDLVIETISAPGTPEESKQSTEIDLNGNVFSNNRCRRYRWRWCARKNTI